MASRFEIAYNVFNKELAKPYKAGVSDCFIAALRVADKLSSTRKAKKYVKTYKTIKQSQVELKRLGFETLGDLLASEFEEIPASQAQVGDIVTVIEEEAEHACVCFGAQFACKDEYGKRIFTLSQVSKAYRV